MCGICGFIDTRRQQDEAGLGELAARMAATLRHRGPDDAGAWADADVGVALGHTRLSVIDLSEAGHQPMVSACGRYLLLFNGEIYNYRNIAEALRFAGYAFRGNSDTEVVVAGVATWGFEATLDRLNGMFALAVWDRAERTLRLARDRLGEKPLYYGWRDGVFLFGSELKALRQHPAFRGTVDRDVLAAYLRFGYVPDSLSIYSGVFKLPPASFLEVRSSTSDALPAPRKYWSLRDAVERGVLTRLRCDEVEAADRLEAALRKAVGRRCHADVPLGAFLSGGVDSSTVVALMQAETGQRVQTFTIGFHDAKYNEAEHAKAVAAHLGTEHTELYVTPEEALAVVPKLPELYDEPFSDSSQIPTHLVAQLARRAVTVCLSGDGGDELFAGYDRYAWASAIWRRAGWAPRRLRRWLARGMTRVAPESWDDLAAQLAPVTPGAWQVRNPGDKLHKLAEVLDADDADALYLGLVSHWKAPSEVVIGGHEPVSIFERRDCQPAVNGFVERAMFLDTATYLPGDLLTKVDRASMGVSLEVRVPMLDHELAEFAWRVPLSMKVRGMQSKWLLRQVLYRHVPAHLIERPKTGFGVPLDAWLRGPLRDWAASLLDPARLRDDGYFHAEPITRAWEAHLSGRRNLQYRLWAVLMFQAWLDHTRSGSHNAAQVVVRT